MNRSREKMKGGKGRVRKRGRETEGGEAWRDGRTEKRKNEVEAKT